MFKIALTGSHGVGKTTLLEALAERLSLLGKVVAVPEVARDLIAEVGDSRILHRGHYGGSIDTYILARQLELDSQAWLGDAKFALHDRGMMDNWAYWTLRNPAEVASLHGQLFLNLAKRWAKHYDLVVHLPVEFKLYLDGVREDDEAFRQAVDSEVLAAWHNAGIRPVTVGGSMNERADKIMALIEAGALAKIGHK